MLKFSCEKALLQLAVNTASRTVATKSSIPGLEGLLLVEHSGRPNQRARTLWPSPRWRRG